MTEELRDAFGDYLLEFCRNNLVIRLAGDRGEHFVGVKYTDQVAQETAVTDKDFIGRPVRREYADGTFEHFQWEGPRISRYTNRQGQTVTYTYYQDTGKLSQIIGSVVLDEFRYDAAGRVSMMRTPDAEIDVDSCDKEGHPLHVTETRIINGTPSSTLEQTYTWNLHGERTAWTMPRLGTSQNGWSDTVDDPPGDRRQ